MTTAEREALVRWLVREEPGYLGRAWFRVLGGDETTYSVRESAEEAARGLLRRVMKGVSDE